ncbi:hypothetical protein HanRHA438_Chr13g0615551 [Helianthus annuus]|nr:hypothetical protein HanRHA438_Chr13g0615551 [Helianthus annuus]
MPFFCCVEDYIIVDSLICYQECKEGFTNHWLAISLLVFTVCHSYEYYILYFVNCIVYRMLYFCQRFTVV